MSLVNLKNIWIDYNLIKKRGVHHHLLVLLPRNKGEQHGKNLQIYIELDHHSLNEVWQSEVVGLLHVLSVEKPTQINVMIATRVALCVIKKVTSWGSSLRTDKILEIRTTEPNLQQLLYYKGFPQLEPFLVLGEGKTASRQSLATYSKITLKMFSLVWSKSLLLMIMLF